MMIADTDVLIDFVRDAQPFSERVAFEVKPGSFATTSIAAFELVAVVSQPKSPLEYRGGS